MTQKYQKKFQTQLVSKKFKLFEYFCYGGNCRVYLLKSVRHSRLNRGIITEQKDTLYLPQNILENSFMIPYNLKSKQTVVLIILNLTFEVASYKYIY